jgi:hypothetical protein
LIKGIDMREQVGTVGLQGPSNMTVKDLGKQKEAVSDSGVGPIAARFSFGDFVGVYSKVAGTPVPRFLGILQDEIRLKLNTDMTVSVSYLVQSLTDYLDGLNKCMWIDENSKDWVICGTKETGMPHGVQSLIEARLFVGECESRIAMGNRELELRKKVLGDMRKEYQV